jgi:hypothetical protein
MVDHISPQVRALESVSISNNNQKVTRSCDGHIESPLVLQEPQVPRAIGSDTIKDNDILLLTLEGIHRVHWETR